MGEGRRAADVLQIHSLVLVLVLFLATRVQPESPWGLQARPSANSAYAEPLVKSPNSCLNSLRMHKEGQ